MKKRILALLLALVMIVSTLPTAAFAAEGETVTAPEIKSVSMTLNGVLNVNFKVEANGTDMTGYTLKVTPQLGRVQEIKTYTRDENHYYVYTAQLPIHRLTKDVLAVALLNGSGSEVDSGTFKFEDYAEKVNEVLPAIADLTAAMENYGNYAAYYANPTGTVPNVSDVESVTAADLAKYAHKLLTYTGSVVPSVSLFLDDACDLRFSNIGEGCTLYVDGKEVTLTNGAYAIEELLPQNWDKAYTFEVKNGSTTAFKVQYSVLSYVYAKLKKTAEEKTGLNGMLKAMYLYHTEVENYMGANGLHQWVETPDVKLDLYKDGTTPYVFMFDTSDADVKAAVDFINTQLASLQGDASNNSYKLSYPGSRDQEEWNAEMKYIVLDNQTMFKNAGLTMPVADLGETGYYIVTKGNSVFIMVGENADKAQAYQQAALAFLKAVLGYEMYAADCVTYSKVTDPKNITMSGLQIVEKPDIDYRNRGSHTSVGNGTYGMGYTNNGIFMSVDGEVYHTALKLLNPDTYYKKVTLGIGALESNPWFRYWDADTSWFGSYPLYQLCYTTILENAEVTVNSQKVKPMDIIYNGLKTAILANPNLDNISFGPSDTPECCDCSKCQSAGATASYVKVANALAERLAADPEIGRTVKLIVFAYRAYEDAPVNVTIHENVGVMVAPIEAAWNKPLSDQTDYANQIKAWAELTDHLYLWMYQANFDNYLYPMDSWDVMDDNIQFAREVGADYVFYQNHGNTAAPGFSKLKDYLEIQLMRNANADYNTLVNSFFTNYFGPAAEKMKEYFNALQTHMNTFSTGKYKEAIATTANWPQAKLNEFMDYIDAAYAAVAASGSADAGTYNKRINLESLFPRFALYTLYSSSNTDQAGFAADLAVQGITNYSEGTAWNASDYKNWGSSHNHTYENNVADKYLKSGATEASGAVYYKNCSACGAIDYSETFVSGSPLGHDTHTYTFVAGEGENEGYDVGTCSCGETVKVKTDYTASAPIDIINGTAATLTMPADFTGTVTGGAFGNTLTFEGTTFDTTSIPVANHGLWKAIDVTFTSEYGGTHTAQIPAILITKVIQNETDFQSFATDAANAWAGGTVMYGYYILGGDIDCGSTTVSAADAWNQGQFYGTLDGRGHKIQNLAAAAYKTGIFGRLHGTVKDIHFTGVKMNANSALFGKITDGSTFTDVTIDVASWATPTDNTYTGILGLSQNQNLVLNNLVINVADGVTVPQLIGRTFTGATGNVSVNLGVETKVINYYSTANNGSSGVATLPTDSIITVKQKVAQEITDEVIIEGNTWTQAIAGAPDGAAAVTFAGQSFSGTVTNGTLTVSLTGVTPAGKLSDSVVVSVGDATYSYTNVLHVTQIIDTVAELKALGAACKAASTTGYYILGADIDCSAEANMAAGNPGWQKYGFSGTFDGRGKKISNIKMTWDNATQGYGGLFGNLVGGTIKNVTFDKVNYASTNVTLFGRHNVNIAGVANATIENMTVNISGWAATGEAGVFASRGTLNTVYNNVVINVADGLTVHNLLGQEWNSNHGTGITVNLGVGSEVTAYYWTGTADTTAVTTNPAIVTVNKAYEPIHETIDTLVAAENTATLALTNDAFTGTVTATVDGNSATATVSGNTVSVDLTGVAMGKHEVVVTTEKGDTYTYTEAWYVTQVIDNATELKDLGAACKAANTTGYYILGGDIDCSGEANMAAGNPGWQLNGFSGTFDGRGKKISNIKMTWDNATQGYGGLFGNLAGATIQNVVFDKVNYASTNVALFGRHSYASGGNNVNLKNLTINVSGWGATGTSEAGLLLSKNMQNTITTNVIVNVDDGLTINTLLGADCSSIAYVTLTVNLGTGSSITNYYGTTTAKPDTITVNTSGRAKVTETLDTLVAGENTTNVTFTHGAFSTCTTAKVAINGVTKENVAITNGTITVNLADYGVSTMGQYSAVVTTDYGDVLTYTDVWYVTQSIDTVAELKALGAACKAANTTGYYILGGDIDCSGEPNMAAGNPGWEANGFSGTFNGRNKTISNIKLTWDNATQGYGGLFGNLDGCLIENVVFDKVNYASVNVALLGRHTYKNKGADNTRLNNLTINVSNWGATGEAGLLVSRSSRNTLFNDITVNLTSGVTVHNLLGQGFSSLYGSGITVNLNGGAVTAVYWTGTDASTAVTTATLVTIQ